jgi:hypothetical protein
MELEPRLDHIVLTVRHLAGARREFTALGFNVIPGGVHAGGLTQNALIVLADGSYLELLAPAGPWSLGFYQLLRWAGLLRLLNRGASTFQRRFTGHLARGPGLADFALLSPDLEAGIVAARRRGLPLEGPLPGERMRPDRQRVAWRFAFPPDDDLPFLIEDVTPRDRRVPSGAAREHPNGVTGIGSLEIAVQDLRHRTGRYRALLGQDGHSGPGDPPNAPPPVAFEVAGQALILREVPQEKMVEIGLAGRKAGPAGIWLRADAANGLVVLRYTGAGGYSLTPGPPLAGQIGKLAYIE